jgi:hypothetical protein
LSPFPTAPSQTPQLVIIKKQPYKSFIHPFIKTFCFVFIINQPSIAKTKKQLKK